MLTIPPQACRNSVLMPDGRYRTVPSAQEVGSYIQLRRREFPDGSQRLSVSVRGLWSICLNGVFFPKWSEGLLARFVDDPDAYFAQGGKDGDVFLDATRVHAAIGHSTSKRNRAVMVIVNEALVRDAVTSGVRNEMLAIFALTSDALRVKRIRELLGDGHDVTFGDQAAVGDSKPDGDSVSDVDADDSGVDPGRFVPVVDREVGGRVVATVDARDMHVFLGGGYVFANWIREQTSRANLVEDKDFRKVFSKTGNNPAGGRPRVDYVLTLDAAKEIGMLDKGPRGKDLRLYFLECERRLEAGETAEAPTLRSNALASHHVPALAHVPPPISVDNMPNSLHAFLATKGFSPGGSINEHLRSAENALVRSVTEARLPGHSCCRSPGHGGWVFTRAALDAWWLEHEAEFVLASLGR